MDGEFNLFQVEQDLTSTEFKNALRAERAAKKAQKAQYKTERRQGKK